AKMESRAKEFWKPEWKIKDEFTQRTNEKIDQNETMNSTDTVILEGREFAVHPGVFSPSIFIGSKFLCNKLCEFLPDSGTFLEIGSGCGCVAVLVAQNRPRLRIFAVDISQSALENTLENLKRHRLTDRVKVTQSDVMDAFVDAGEVEKFDCVFWNYPFHHTDKSIGQLTMTERAIRDPNYACLHKLFDQASQLVSPGGKVLIGFSIKMGIVEALVAIARHYGWQTQEKANGLDFEGERTSMAIFECVRFNDA
ncbi:hypothetical protein BOX15_Mlig010635g1, partial [Macrostomum lignano]